VTVAASACAGPRTQASATNPGPATMVPEAARFLMVLMAFMASAALS
jgi:hypothetical protein